MIFGDDGTYVNVDIDNLADAFLIVRAVNERYGYAQEADQATEMERAYDAAQEMQ